MTTWFKQPTSLLTDPRLLDAGALPAFLAILLLQEHAAAGADGRLPVERSTPRAIRRLLRAFDVPPDAADAAFAELVGAGLVRAPDGEITLLFWNERDYGNRCSRCGCMHGEPRESRCARCREDDRNRRSAHADDAQADPCAQPAPAQNGRSTPPARNLQESQKGENEGKQARRARAGARKPGPAAPDPAGRPAARDQTESAPGGAPDRSEQAAADPVVALHDVLAAAGFERPVHRWKAAGELHERGLTADTAQELWELAQRKGDKPPGLFAHWIRQGLWRDVLAEVATKRREAGVQARGRMARDAADHDAPVVEPAPLGPGVCDVIDRAASRCFEPAASGRQTGVERASGAVTHVAGQDPDAAAERAAIQHEAVA